MWIACYTAVDFYARLRFPRAAAESPRRFAPAGSHLFRFFCRSLRLALQSPVRSNYLYEICFQHYHEKLRMSWILHPESRLIIRIFLQREDFCSGLFCVSCTKLMNIFLFPEDTQGSIKLKS